MNEIIKQLRLKGYNVRMIAQEVQLSEKWVRKNLRMAKPNGIVADVVSRALEKPVAEIFPELGEDTANISDSVNSASDSAIQNDNLELLLDVAKNLNPPSDMREIGRALAEKHNTRRDLELRRATHKYNTIARLRTRCTSNGERWSEAHLEQEVRVDDTYVSYSERINNLRREIDLLEVDWLLSALDSIPGQWPPIIPGRETL